MASIDYTKIPFTDEMSVALAYRTKEEVLAVVEHLNEETILEWDYVGIADEVGDRWWWMPILSGQGYTYIHEDWGKP